MDPKWKLRGGLVKSISAGQSMIHVLPSFVLILLSPFFALYYLLFHSLFLVSSLPPFLHDILMYRQTIGKFWLFLPDSLFSPKAPITKGPLLPWNLNVCQIHVKFKRPIGHFRQMCHFGKNRHSPRGPFCPIIFRLIFYFCQIRQFCQTSPL